MVWDKVVQSDGGRGGGPGGGGAGYRIKKQEPPHKDVGNNPTWWLIPRIVSGLVHPSLFSELTRSLSHVNHWGELTHLLSG